MKKNILFCILSTSLLSGCSSFSKDEVEKAPVPQYQPSIVSEKEVYDAFIKAAENVDKAFLVYTNVNNAAKSEELTYEKIRQANWKANYTPPGMERKITMNWDGPLRPLISQIAKESGYEILFVGELPPEPHIITINAKEKRIIDVINDISSKVDSLVDISIYDINSNENSSDIKLNKGFESKNKVNLIEVRYVDGFR